MEEQRIDSGTPQLSHRLTKLSISCFFFPVRSITVQHDWNQILCTANWPGCKCTWCGGRGHRLRLPPHPPYTWGWWPRWWALISVKHHHSVSFSKVFCLHRYWQVIRQTHIIQVAIHPLINAHSSDRIVKDVDLWRFMQAQCVKRRIVSNADGKVRRLTAGLKPWLVKNPTKLMISPAVSTEYVIKTFPGIERWVKHLLPGECDICYVRM